MGMTMNSKLNSTNNITSESKQKQQVFFQAVDDEQFNNAQLINLVKNDVEIILD